MSKEIKADVVISPDGKMTVITQNGTFEDGQEKMELFVEGLETGGVKITQGPYFEQHRHDEEEVHHHHHLGVSGHE